MPQTHFADQHPGVLGALNHAASRIILPGISSVDLIQTTQRFASVVTTDKKGEYKLKKGKKANAVAAECMAEVERACAVYADTYGNDPDILEDPEEVVGFYVEKDGKGRITGLSEDYVHPDEYNHNLVVATLDGVGPVDVGALTINVIGDETGYFVIDYCGVRTPEQIRKAVPNIPESIGEEELALLARQAKALLYDHFMSFAQRVGEGEGFLVVEAGREAATEHQMAKELGLKSVPFEGRAMARAVREAVSETINELEGNKKKEKELAVARRFETELGNNCDSFFSAPHSKNGPLTKGMTFYIKPLDPEVTSLSPEQVTDFLGETVPEFVCTNAEKKVYLGVIRKVIEKIAERSGGVLKLKNA